jgi:hypothetical protein
MVGQGLLLLLPLLLLQPLVPPASLQRVRHQCARWPLEQKESQPLPWLWVLRLLLALRC